VLGALGDFALARPGERAFLAGMAAFAAGHLAYAGAFAGAAGMPSLPVLAAGVVLAAGAAALLGPRAGPLVWPVRGYGAVIGAMAACALALPDPAARAGAALFVASDALLAVALFRAPGQGALRPLGLAVWSCYWLGQALILLGMQP
ncbi:MAG TPA: lysoplasmalogenase family protein, partial [Paracoccaceae bacterium]|nr:lysoplasmalogenase family protein [Paracoccaceae bacterium]